VREIPRLLDYTIRGVLRSVKGKPERRIVRHGMVILGRLARLARYLEASQPLAEFLDEFPTVSRNQAVAALEQAK
jgi:hypothetical protein